MAVTFLEKNGFGKMLCMLFYVDSILPGIFFSPWQESAMTLQKNLETNFEEELFDFINVDIISKQSEFIQSILALINNAIRLNSNLNKIYTLEVITGPTFIRVNLVQHYKVIRTIIVISFKRDSRLSKNGIYEYRNHVYTFGVEGRLPYNVSVDNKEELYRYIHEIVIPFIKIYS